MAAPSYGGPEPKH